MMTWHYTIGDRIEMILAGGLKLEMARVPPGARACIWFTRSDAWDDTANKLIPADVGGRDLLVALTRDLTHRLGGGLVRIGVADEVAPHEFEHWEQISGCSPEFVKALSESAIQAGVRLADWRVSFEAVPPSRFEIIEYWDSDQQSWTSDAGVRPKSPDRETVGRLIQQGLQDGTLVVKSR